MCITICPRPHHLLSGHICTRPRHHDPPSAREARREARKAGFSTFLLFLVSLAFVLKKAEKIALRRENKRGVIASERLTILLERAVKEEKLWVFGKSPA